MAHLFASMAFASLSHTYNLSVANGAGPSLNAGPTMAIVTSLKDNAGRFHCLDLFGQNPADGTPIDVWTCVSPPIPGQLWFFDTGTFMIRSSVDPTKCIDAGTMRLSTQLSISSCTKPTPKDSQKIGWDAAGALYLVESHLPQLCFAPKHNASGNVTNGSAVALEACSTKAAVAQKWRVNLPPGPIAPNSTFAFRTTAALPVQACLNASAGAPDGAPVSVVRCTNELSQKWVFAAGSYMIRSAAHSGQCLDAGGMVAGTPLTTWGCNRLPQQQWSFSVKGQSVFLGSKEVPHDGGCLNYGPAGGASNSYVAKLGACVAWNLTAV